MYRDIIFFRVACDRIPVLVELLFDRSFRFSRQDSSIHEFARLLNAKKHSDQIFVNFPSTERLSHAILTVARDVRKFRKRKCRHLFLFLSLSECAINFHREFHMFSSEIYCRINSSIYIFDERYISRSINLSRACREKELAD